MSKSFYRLPYSLYRLSKSFYRLTKNSIEWKKNFLIIKMIENYALLKFIEQLQDHNA